MRRPAVARSVLSLEELERRLVLSGPNKLLVPLSPADRTGDQIPTIQAYQDSSRIASGIFDTGSSAVTFSASDQARFKAEGAPIPIKVPGGAHADGVGGPITGDVSQPGLIEVAGVGGGGLSYGPQAEPIFGTHFGAGTAATSGIQAFVATAAGSPGLPTLTGTPILNPSDANPKGLAALVQMEGSQIDFSGLIDGANLSVPNVTFVAPGTPLPSSPNTTDPVKIPMSLFGGDNHTNPGSAVTESPNPVQTDVGLTWGSNTLTHQNYMFDTGSQVTVISTAEARALGLNLTQSLFSMQLQGAGGSSAVPGYTLNALDLPLEDGNVLEFTNVPVFVLDVPSGLDGLLGMNLWNSASALEYDPFGPGGPSVSVSFRELLGQGGKPTGVGGEDGNDAQTVASLQDLGIGLATTVHGNGVPGLAFATGQISGQLYLDTNGNGVHDPSEPGLGGQTVYLDVNHDGQYDPNDPVALTDSNGFYQFAKLAPGTYTVRELTPANLVLTSPASGFTTVVVPENATASGVNFAHQPQAPNLFAAYLNNLYGNVLNRTPDSVGFNAWISYLQSGGSKQIVAQAFWESPEHRGYELTGLYQTYLNRPVDPSGLQHWLTAFQTGATEADVQLGLIDSAEFQAAHADNASFLATLYQDALGRPVDTFGQTTFLQALASGVTRHQIAQAVLNSGEAVQNTLDLYYMAFLHRTADQPGQQTWLNLLQQGGTSITSVAEAFLASGEYLNWGQKLVAS
jgi:hypothetical protein